MVWLIDDGLMDSVQNLVDAEHYDMYLEYSLYKYSNVFPVQWHFSST